MPGAVLPTEVKIAKTPNPPSFATVAEERVHRKQRLASAFRLFAKFGFSEGVAGDITAPAPWAPEPFLGQSLRHAFRPYSRLRPGPGERAGRSRGRQSRNQRVRLRHSLTAAYG